MVKKYLLIFISITLLVNCDIAGNSVTITEPQDLGNNRFNLGNFQSDSTGKSYPIHIALPPEYFESDIAYPVIYALDGWLSYFNNMANIINELDKDVILVTIDPVGDSNREQDYTMWERGAEKYFSFLTKELIPQIEQQYRIDPNNRTVSGHSLGGLFAGLAMLLDDPENPFFNSFISQDGSFWRLQEETVQLEEELAAKTQTLPYTLVLSSGGREKIDTNYDYVLWFKDLLEEGNYQNLEIHYHCYSGLGHDAMYSPSFRSALDLLYP